MRYSVENALWFLTGGKDPHVHIPNLKKRDERTRKWHDLDFDIETLTASIDSVSVVRKHEENVISYRMPIEGIKPVHNVVPFHLKLLSVKGLTLPKMKVVAWVKRFYPKLLMKSLDYAFSAVFHEMKKLPEKLESFKYQVDRSSTISIPIVRLPGVVPTARLKAESIPGYFVRIKPDLFTSYTKGEIALRRNGLADTLHIPRERIKLLALFRNVDVSAARNIEYDQRRRSLKYRPVDNTSFEPVRRDIVVGMDIITGKIHMAKYSAR